MNWLYLFICCRSTSNAVKSVLLSKKESDFIHFLLLKMALNRRIALVIFFTSSVYNTLPSLVCAKTFFLFLFIWLIIISSLSLAPTLISTSHSQFSILCMDPSLYNLWYCVCVSYLHKYYCAIYFISKW